MSSIFLSYRFTGEDPKELQIQLGGIRESLQFAGHDVACSFWLEPDFQRDRLTRDEIYARMLRIQGESDVFMAYVKSDARSYGMQIESKRAVELQQKYVLLERSGVIIPEFEAVANEIITYDTLEVLCGLLRAFK